MKKHLLPVGILLLLTAAVYGRMLGHEFLLNWDDGTYLTDNPDIRGLTLDHLRNAFTRFYIGNYAPLHILSYMVDYTFWGLNPAGYALTNLLLHAANGILFYLLLFRLTGERLWAFLAAALFLVHPVQVESVAWLSQRKNVLAMLFLLLSFLAYVRWREVGETPRRGYYLLALLAFAAALLAKTAVVFLPAVLLLYDGWWCRRRLSRKELLAVAPFALLAIGAAALAVVSQGESGGKAGHLGGHPLFTFLNMLPVLARYLIMLAWPTRLNIIYNTPIRLAVDREVVLSAFLLVLLVAGMVLLARRRRDLFFWAAFFILALLPVANIIPQITLMNDRYLYFPLLGGAAFLVFGPLAALQRSLLRYPRIFRLLVAIFLGFLAIVAGRRVGVWHDSVTLWQDALSTLPEGAWYSYNTHFAEEALADALARKGMELHRRREIAAARHAYLLALTYDPQAQNALLNLANIALKEGRPGKAVAYATTLTSTYRRDDRGFMVLAVACYEMGELARAGEASRQALALNPANEVARSVLQAIETQGGRGAAATVP